MLRGQPEPPGRQRDSGPERPAASRSPDDDQNRVDQQVGAEVGFEVMPALDLGDRSHLFPVELSFGSLFRHGSVVAESGAARPCLLAQSAACVRERSSSLRRMFETWVRAVRSLITSSVAIS